MTGNDNAVEINIVTWQIIGNPKGCLGRYIDSYNKFKLVHSVLKNIEYDI